MLAPWSHRDLVRKKVADCGTFIMRFGCSPGLIATTRPSRNKIRNAGCLFICQQRWCKTVIVREQLCTLDIELLSVSLRPLYLLREFPQLLGTVLYISPRANVDRAAQHISEVTWRFVYRCTQVHIGLIQSVKFENCLSTFHQYITCPTWINGVDNVIELYEEVRSVIKQQQNRGFWNI
jgi:hypothetical protein